MLPTPQIWQAVSIVGPRGLLPPLAALALLHLDDAPRNTPRQRPPCPPRCNFRARVVGGRGTQTLDKAWGFQRQERVINAVSGEDAAKASGYNERDLLCQNCRCSLLSRRSASKVEPRDKNIVKLSDRLELWVIVFHADLCHAFFCDIVLVRVFTRVDITGVEVIGVAEDELAADLL